MITAKEYREQIAPKKKSKYSNVKVEFDGLTFDSKREMNRFIELKEQQKERLISELETQVTFELIPKSKTERACKYIADFMYRDSEYNLVVEDSKGKRTPDYVIKRKLMLHVFGIQIKEV